MGKFSKKVQALLTEQQYEDLKEISRKQKKKISLLVREAVEEYHLKNKKKEEIVAAVNQLLSLPEVPAPEDYQKWEKEYLFEKYSRR